MSKATMEFHALGVVMRVTVLRDPLCKTGYAHFYDPKSNKGFFEWRGKTVNRKSTSSHPKPAAPREEKKVTCLELYWFDWLTKSHMVVTGLKKWLLLIHLSDVSARMVCCLPL